MGHVGLKVYRWVFARRVFRKFNLALFRMSAHGLGILNYESDRVSGERYFLRHLLPKYLKSETPVLFDVGANVGLYSLALLKTFPDATIYAFEPHPSNFVQLAAISSSDRVKAYRLALGEAAGNLTLYDRADQDGSVHASLHREVISEIHKQKVLSFEVVVDTLDAFAEKHGIAYIDFLKVDTEGNELAVLKGAHRLLSEGKIGCIHFEFNEMNIVSRVFMRDFRKLLANYRFYRLLPSGLARLDESPFETEIFAYQNILAIPKAGSGSISAQ